MSDGDQANPRKHQSPTLTVLQDRGPSGKTVCETCPHAVWHSTVNGVKAFCRVFFSIVWSPKEPNEIKLCDGPFLE